jgi:hypothetical protein
MVVADDESGLFPTDIPALLELVAALVGGGIGPRPSGYERLSGISAG